MKATLSSRLSRGYRILLVLLCVSVAGAVGPAGRAFADATVASPSPSVSCQLDELDVSSTVGGPTTYAPGQVATVQASVHNRTSVDLAGAWFQFQLVAPTAPATAPTVSWSVDGSGWPGLNLHSISPWQPDHPVWLSDEVALLPTLAAGSTHTLHLQATFHADSPAGNYTATIMFGAQICHDQVLGAALGMSFTLYTTEGRTGCCIGNQGGSSSAGAGARKPASVPPTAPVSATPGAPSASPAPTGSVNSVVAAMPSASATPTQDLAGGASITSPPKIAWLGALLMLAIAALVSLWGRIVNPARVRGPARLGHSWGGASRRVLRTGTDPETEPADRNR